jgi:hypothetical protein
MHLLVTGSRTWTDVQLIRDHLSWYNSLIEPVTLIHGACPRGADAIANRIAFEYCWTIERYPADWQQHGKRAGYVRNAEMVNQGADICLAFIKDESPGATMCADLAEKAGIPVERIRK